jgi:hypothetical protein
MMKNRKKQRRSALRFDIAVNGKRVCLAGSGRYGVLSLALTWVGRDPRKPPQSRADARRQPEECKLRIGALTGDYLESWETLPVKRGDEIAIRVLGSGLIEVPLERSRAIHPKATSSRAKKLEIKNSGESGARWVDDGKSKDHS